MKQKELAELRLGKPLRVTAGLGDHEHPAISPDGRWIAYYCGEYGSIEVLVCAIDGRFARRVSPFSGNSTQPAWHPSGRRLAYRHQHTSEAKWEIWETALLGDTAPRALLADPMWHYKHPCYDARGERLAYFSNEGCASGAYHIWILYLASGERGQVSFGDSQMHCHPVFSPDGQRIVYHAYRGTDENTLPPVTNLYELDLRTGESVELTRGEDQYKHPFYIDNRAITFHFEDNETGLRRLCAMHIPSRSLVKLTDGTKNDKHPFPWTDGEDRRWIAWSSKDLGEEQPGEADSYDIFLARLKT
jgi:Tol biopolymer transport system component